MEMTEKQEFFAAKLGSRVRYFNSAEWSGDMKVRKGQVAKFLMNGVGYAVTMLDDTVFCDHQWLTFTREDGEEASTFAANRNLKRGYADVKEAMLGLIQVCPWLAPMFVSFAEEEVV